jgi:hypothetical protein
MRKRPSNVYIAGMKLEVDSRRFAKPFSGSERCGAAARVAAGGFTASFFANKSYGARLFVGRVTK